ncbi:MAG: membrane protein, partial [Acidobacteria bacterium]
MPESIDWPRMNPLKRRRRRFLLIIAVLAGIFVCSWTSLSYYVDVLWFGSLGYEDVFWKTVRLQSGIFTVFAVTTFLILYGSFLALKRAHLPDLPSGQTIIVGGQTLELPVESALRLRYAPHATGSIADPIFGRPLNFFLFTLGAWQLLAGWLLTLAVITCLIAIFFIIVTGGARALTGHRRSYVPLPWRGFSITFAFLLLVLAMRVYLGRFERMLDGHTIFGGVTYTDAHVMLTGMLIVCAALVLGAA